MRVTSVAITQQPEKYAKHLPKDLSRYCHFRETLLTPSRVGDMSTIYQRRYAVGAFVAIPCTNKSGFSRRHSVLAIGSHSKPCKARQGHSHLLAQECCYHCPAGSRQLQRGLLLQLSERESDHTAHEEER